jgi:membrane protease YdiL (CAAX protease family)
MSGHDEFAPFLLLLVAVLGIWIHRYVWIGALLAAIIAACFTGALRGYAFLWIALLGIFALNHRVRITNPGFGLPPWISALLFGGLALFLALSPPAGFLRVPVVEGVVLSPGAKPWSLGVGFPNVVTGIFILGILHQEHARSWRELGEILKRVAPVFLVTVAAVMVCTLALGYVRLDPKWTPLFLVWAIANLFFSCMAQEAFFRGFVQRELAALGSNRTRAAWIAISATAVLFGLAHLGGGWKYALASTLAGLGYGWAYHRTQRVEGAMAVHFGLNATHFLLFTYPALSG